MAHAYDTGLAQPIRTVLRDGVVTRLARLQASQGGYLRALIPFGNRMLAHDDVDGLDFLLKVLNGRAPAVAVAIGDRTFNAGGAGGYNQRATYDVLVYVAGNHMRSREARQAGDVASAASDVKDPGLDTILEHVEELLTGWKVDSSNVIGELRPSREVERWNDDRIAVWEQLYTVPVSRSINQDRDIVARLTRIDTQHKFDGVAIAATQTEIP